MECKIFIIEDGYESFLNLTTDVNSWHAVFASKKVQDSIYKRVECEHNCKKVLFINEMSWG